MNPEEVILLAQASNERQDAGGLHNGLFLLIPKGKQTATESVCISC